MNKEVKTFIVKAIKFLLLLVIIDQAGGLVVRHFFFQQSSGKYYRITYAMDQSDDDIMVFGSSHANRHFDTEIIEEQTGMTCYNAGVQGQRILFHEAMQAVVYKRHVPKITILCVDLDWMHKIPEAYDRLSDLNPYYFKYPEEIRPVILMKSKFEPYKNFSKLYQYNSTIVHIIKYWLQPQPDIKGYRPLEGSIGKNYKIPENQKKEIDENFVSSLERFIKNAKETDTRLVMVITPMIYEFPFENDPSFRIIQQLADEYHVPLINYLNDTVYLGNDSIFKDYNHLNKTGAAMFSKSVSREIKNPVD